MLAKLIEGATRRRISGPHVSTNIDDEIPV